MSYKQPITGFHNLGSTCYFNALIQSIISCNIFMDEINKIDINNYELYVKNTVSDISAINIIKLFQSYKVENNNLSKLSANIWYELIKTTPSYFQMGQQCAAEGFTLLLDVLDKYSDIKQLFYHRVRSRIYCPDCNNVVSDNKNMENMFIVESNLNNEQIDCFKEIHNTSTNIKDFVINNTGFIEGYTCEKCKIKSNKFTINNLTMVPSILVINYKNYDKQCHNITNIFPEQLIFNGKKNNLIYKAVAQIEHSGSVHSGHYWALCKRNNKWYNLNDMNISNVSGFLPTNNTYMIFYTIIQNP